ncbi:redoxin family protein [Roseivirga sp.]|uniref:redoxin family protein n=1 Tax=Roseivirga sp. TaxID=1964215 RepID=UPI003B8B6A8C
MKNRVIPQFLLILLLIVGLFSCDEKQEVPADGFIVTGNIPGLETEFMSTSYRGPNGERVNDSVFVENGEFTYIGKIATPSFIVFWPNDEKTIKRSGRGYYPAKSSQFAFLASPGDRIEFKGEVTDFINAYPSGTQANDDLAKINSEIFPMLNDAVNLQLEINTLEEGDAKKDNLKSKMAGIEEQVLAVKTAFVQNNPNSKAAAWYLSDMMVRSQVSQEDAIATFKSFDTALKGYTFYEQVAMRVEGIESTLPGKIMPNFTTNLTLDGEPFELNELRGKHVLIDFWGIWCGPCVAEMPKVKEYKEKYKDELVILGINSGDTKERIEKFIGENGYDWTQVMTGQGANDLVLKLNVAGFPTKFILDPKGEILHRYVGETIDAFDAIDQILQD